MAHNLFLGMYTFSIKKRRSRLSTRIDNNTFLELAYPSVSGNKFVGGFVKDIISLLDEKAYKNAQNTHGATLDDYKIDKNNRTLDILINGGLTGIKQYIIKEDGEQKELSGDDIIGPKFFARFWFPAASDTGYVFIQKYGGMSIKPIFDSILKDLFSTHEFSIINSIIKPTTTKKRLKLFLKHAALKDITIVSASGINSTSEANASTVEVRLKNFNTIKTLKKTSYIDIIRKALSNHELTIGNRAYEIKGTYEYENNGVHEERTMKIDATEETTNIVPNIVIPPYCVDTDNYPIFEKMRELVDSEMEQVKIEAKL